MKDTKNHMETNNIENEFGLATAFVTKLSDRKFETPDNLARSLCPLFDFGLWNIPFFSRSSEIKATYANKYQTPFSKQMSNNFYEDTSIPPSFNSLFSSQETQSFIVPAWQKAYHNYRYSNPLGYLLLNKSGFTWTEQPTKEDIIWHFDINCIAKQCRALNSVEEVIESGLIEKFCDLILIEKFAKWLADSVYTTKKSYNWIYTLASFLIPAKEITDILNYSVGSLYKTIGQPDNKLIWKIIDKKVMERWGTDKVVNEMRCNNGHSRNDEYNWVGQYTVYRSFSLDCLSCLERLAKAEKLKVRREEIVSEFKTKYGEDTKNYPKTYMGTLCLGVVRLEWNLSWTSLEEMESFYNKYVAIAKDEETIKSEVVPIFSSPVDPFTNEVLGFIEKLTKLGVSPDKAAEAAVKLVNQL